MVADGLFPATAWSRGWALDVRDRALLLAWPWSAWLVALRRRSLATAATAARVTRSAGRPEERLPALPRQRGAAPSVPAAPRRWLPRPRHVLRALVWTVVVAEVGLFAASLGVPLWYQVHGQRLLIVTSGSMAPFVQAGDVAVLQEIDDPSQLRVGQVATFWPPGSRHLVTHRIVDMKMLPALVQGPGGKMVPQLDGAGQPVMRPYIYTKGDANRTRDPNATPLVRVRGVVVSSHAAWGRWLGWASRPPAGSPCWLPRSPCSPSSSWSTRSRSAGAGPHADRGRSRTRWPRRCAMRSGRDRRPGWPVVLLAALLGVVVGLALPRAQETGATFVDSGTVDAAFQVGSCSGAWSSTVAALAPTRHWDFGAASTPAGDVAAPGLLVCDASGARALHGTDDERVQDPAGAIAATQVGGMALWVSLSDATAGDLLWVSQASGYSAGLRVEAGAVQLVEIPTAGAPVAVRAQLPLTAGGPHLLTVLPSGSALVLRVDQTAAGPVTLAGGAGDLTMTLGGRPGSGDVSATGTVDELLVLAPGTGASVVGALLAARTW